MKLAWLTDIHLNFLSKSEREIFYEKILSKNCDAVLITGDISEATCLKSILIEMENHIQKPIYFLLGNHDYYRSNVGEVRDMVTDLSHTNERLYWLPAAGIQILNKYTILLGQDGWADGRIGNYQSSWVVLNDSRLIEDLFHAKIHGRSQLLEKMQHLADTDALQLEKNLSQAVKKDPMKIIILTHVPPFEEICIYRGKISDRDWLPFYSSKATGDILQSFAQQHPSIEFLVLCGHTHSSAEYKPIDNLTVKSGGAIYSEPEIQELIII